MNIFKSQNDIIWTSLNFWIDRKISWIWEKTEKLPIWGYNLIHNWDDFLMHVLCVKQASSFKGLRSFNHFVLIAGQPSSDSEIGLYQIETQKASEGETRIMPILTRLLLWARLRRCHDFENVTLDRVDLCSILYSV